MVDPNQVFYIVRLWLAFLGIDYGLQFVRMCVRYYLEFLQ